MSTIVLKSETCRPGRLRGLLDWLRQARAALSVPAQEMGSLSEHQLLDIGVDPHDGVSAIDQEVTRLGLLDLGWQQPRRARRR